MAITAADPVRRAKTETGNSIPAQIAGSGYRSMCEGGPVVRCFWVASRHEEGMEYAVYLHPSGRLSCGCPASRYRGMCAHRRAVQRALEVEAAHTRKAEASAEQEVTRYGITPKGMAYLKRWRAEQAELAEKAARETAPLRRSNNPFSMMR